MSRSSAQDKIDQTYIEYAIYSLWKINVLDYIKIKASIAKSFHIAPSELDKMPYWEYEYFIGYLNDLNKQENEEQENMMEKYKVDNKYKSPKIPKMNIPKI